MRTDKNNPRHNVPPEKPMGMVGSGPLTALIWKSGHQDSGWRYQFSLFRQLRAGKVSQLFRPLDLIYFIKLLQVLAAVIADDGCLSPVETGVLRRVEQDLDRLLQRASQRRYSGDATSSPEITGVDDEKSSGV